MDGGMVSWPVADEKVDVVDDGSRGVAGRRARSPEDNRQLAEHIAGRHAKSAHQLGWGAGLSYGSPLRLWHGRSAILRASWRKSLGGRGRLGREPLEWAPELAAKSLKVQACNVACLMKLQLIACSD
jgi:hypothetical protein